MHIYNYIIKQLNKSLELVEKSRKCLSCSINATIEKESYLFLYIFYDFKASILSFAGHVEEKKKQLF